MHINILTACSITNFEIASIIYIISIASKVFIVGATADHINLISEVTAQDTLSEIFAQAANRSTTFKTNAFKNVLEGVNVEYKGEETKAPRTPGHSFSGGLKTLQEQIEKIKRILHAQ